MSKRPTVLVTGGASGIGRSCAISFADKGYDMTVLDLDAGGLASLAKELKARGAEVLSATVDVRNNEQMASAVKLHAEHFGSLDVAVLNAGIGENISFFKFADTTAWEKCLDIDLRAVLVGIEQCAKAMAGLRCKGSIISIASAAGIFPVPDAPVYAAAKGGVVHFTRSAGPRMQQQLGVTLCTICPEYVDTPLVRKMLESDRNRARALIPNLDQPLLKPQHVAELVLDCSQGRHPAGSVLLLLQSGKLLDPFRRQKATPGSSLAAPVLAAPISSRDRARLVEWAAGHPPPSYKKLVVHQLSSNFQAAAQIVEAPLSLAAPAGKVLVRRTFVGVNASDINYSNGRYHNSRKEAEQQLPLEAGFETVGVVAAVSDGVEGFAVGDPVAAISYGGFAEYGLEGPKTLLRVPTPSPEVLALLVSGLTASIALEQCGRMKSGETVLVTAAAGGTGQFAVQLAKAAGNHVIATCSGGSKSELLRSLGADRVVDYKQESLKEILKREYPKGVDIVYESVGGEFFDNAVNALAPGGRLIIIGMMASYKEGWPPSSHPGLAEKLLWKSATVSGFFLLRQLTHARRHLAELVKMLAGGRLVVSLDGRRFVGVGQVVEAVEYLQSGRSVGKVVVQLARELPGMGAAKL